MVAGIGFHYFSGLKLWRIITTVYQFIQQQRYPTNPTSTDSIIVRGPLQFSRLSNKCLNIGVQGMVILSIEL